MKFLLLLILFIVIASDALASENINCLDKNNLVSFDFKKISVRELLQFIAEAMNCNLIMSENVTGYISLHLKDVAWQQAFDGILEMMGLVKRENNHFLFVGTPAEFALRQKILAEAAPLKIIEVELKHIDVNLAESLIKAQSELFSPSLKILANPQSNTLLIKENINNIDKLKNFLQRVDKLTKQVLITAKIINIDNNKVQELGLRFTDKSSQPTGNSLSLALPHSSMNSFHLAIANAAQNQLLNLQLDALEVAGHSTLIADPKIITQNRKVAVIEAGEEIPYQESTSSGATNTTFKKAVLSLRVKPSLLPDGRIILELEINQNQVSTIAVNGIPAIQTQEVKTEVIVQNGETVILGGIFEKAAACNKNKIPFIANLPIVGNIFSYKSEKIKLKQLLILISPQIIRE